MRSACATRSASAVGSLTNTVVTCPRAPPSSPLAAPATPYPPSRGSRSPPVPPPCPRHALPPVARLEFALDRALRPPPRSELTGEPRQHPRAPDERKDEGHENDLATTRREHCCYFTMAAPGPACRRTAQVSRP